MSEFEFRARPSLDHEASSSSWNRVLAFDLPQIERPTDWDYCQVIAELAARIETLEATIQMINHD